MAVSTPPFPTTRWTVETWLNIDEFYPQAPATPAFEKRNVAVQEPLPVCLQLIAAAR